MSASRVRGGCLCGGIRYEVDPAGTFDAGYCHCSMCRRSTGAPVLAWALLHAGAFRLLTGTPRRYRSSDACDRLHCPVCGCQLFYELPDQPGFRGIHIATLDGDVPTALRPRLHMCVADRLPWLAIADDLPRFEANEVTHPDSRPVS